LRPKGFLVGVVDDGTAGGVEEGFEFLVGQVDDGAVLGHGQGDLVVKEFAAEVHLSLRGQAVLEIAVAAGEETGFLLAGELAHLLERLVGAQGAGDGQGVVVVFLADALGTAEVEEDGLLEGVAGLGGRLGLKEEVDGFDHGFADELGQEHGLFLLDLAQHLLFALGGEAVGDGDFGPLVFEFGNFGGGGLSALAHGTGGFLGGGAGGTAGLVAFDVEGVGAVVEVIGGQHLVGRGVVQHQLGVGGGHLVGGLVAAQLGGGLLRGHAHGAQEVAVVDLHGDAGGVDVVVVVGVGGDGVGGGDVLDAVGLFNVEVVQRQHFGGEFAVDGVGEVVVLVGDVDAYLGHGQGIVEAAAVVLAVVAYGGDGVAAAEEQRAGQGQE